MVPENASWTLQEELFLELTKKNKLLEVLLEKLVSPVSPFGLPQVWQSNVNQALVCTRLHGFLTFAMIRFL